jgi:dGTPase
LASRAFRRLAGKTQVVALPGEPLVRSRLTHTLEVSSIARELARQLGLCEVLVETIALAHDVGHPAFGHAGERALAALVPGGFHHAAHGVRVFTLLEPLQLSAEVVDGVLKHSKGKGGPIFARGWALAKTTAEALAVRAADLFAYACHDVDDAFVLGVLRGADLPTSVARTLGDHPAAIRETLVTRTVRSSLVDGELALDPEIVEALLNLRSFLFERVYESPPITAQTAFVRSLFQSIWESFCERPHLFAAKVGAPVDTPAAELFVDTLAAMTDRQVLRLARDLGIPRRARSWPPSPTTGAFSWRAERPLREMTARRRSTTLTGNDRSTQ